MGEASARLLVAGAARPDRLDALNLLGLLIDHADPEGLVRLPFETLSGEFGVEAGRGRELLEALMAVGVVRAVGDGVAVGGTPPVHAGAFRLSGYLANVATVLDPPAGSGPPAPAEPAVGAPPIPVLRGRRGASHPLAARVLPRALVGVAAALAVVWSTASPSGEPTAVRTGDGSSVPTGRAPWAVTPTTVTAGQAMAPVGDDPSPPPASPVAPVTPAVPTREGNRTDAGRPEPAPGAPESPDEASSTSPPPGRPLTPGTPPARPAPRTPAPPRAPGPVVPPPEEPGSRCPVGTPGAEVLDVRLLPAVGPGLLTVLAEPGVEVRGTLGNPTDADLVVRSFEVRVGEVESAPRVAGSPAPLPVPAGGSAEWRVVLPPEVGFPHLGLVEVRILDWSWTDPVLNAICLS